MARKKNKPKKFSFRGRKSGAHLNAIANIRKLNREKIHLQKKKIHLQKMIDDGVFGVIRGLKVTYFWMSTPEARKRSKIKESDYSKSLDSKHENMLK